MNPATSNEIFRSNGPSVAPYSFEEQIDRAVAWEKEHGIRLLRLSDWNCDPADVALPIAMIQGAVTDALASLTHYAETAVLVEACEEIRADLIAEYAVRFDASARVHLVGNATQALFGVMYALKATVAEPRALIIHPSYYSVQDAADQCGVPVFEMWRNRVGRYAIDLDKLEEHRKRHMVNIVFVTDPVYSLGRCLADVEFDALIDYCADKEIWLVVDLALSGLSWTDSTKVWVDRERLERGSFRKLILVDSPAKRLFANNLKVGLVFADVEIVERLREFSDWHLGNLAGVQLMFARALFKRANKRDIETVSQANVARAVNNYRTLEEIVGASAVVSLVMPEAGFHTILFATDSTSRNVDAMAACHRLVADMGVLAIPTNDFFFDLDDEFGIRLNLMYSPSRWGPSVAELAMRGIL